MGDLRERVGLEVQAALLNAGCSDSEAVQAALEAVAEFVKGSNSDMLADEFAEHARKAWDATDS